MEGICAYMKFSAYTKCLCLHEMYLFTRAVCAYTRHLCLHEVCVFTWSVCGYMRFLCRWGICVYIRHLYLRVVLTWNANAFIWFCAYRRSCAYTILRFMFRWHVCAYTGQDTCAYMRCLHLHKTHANVKHFSLVEAVFWYTLAAVAQLLHIQPHSNIH